jgi:hypothetical protein
MSQPTSAASGSQAATINTEHTLTTQTTGGWYTLVLDTNAMANGDTLEIRGYLKCKTGSTSRLAFIETRQNVQLDIVQVFGNLPVDTEVIFSIKQTSGTGRTYDWNVLRS